MTEAALALPALAAARERRLQPEGAWERALAAAEAAWRSRHVSRSRPHPVADERLRTLSDPALLAEACALRRLSRRHAPGGQAARQAGAQALALSREAAARALGQRAYDVQMAGAAAALHGAAVEMATGEGKTLTAALTAAAAALTGMPSVHVVTANDYLAERDTALTTPFYRLLGLSCGAVAASVSPSDRAAAYRCDVTVCTGKDLAFDYKRDRLRARRAHRSATCGAVRAAGRPRRGAAPASFLGPVAILFSTPVQQVAFTAGVFSEAGDLFVQAFTPSGTSLGFVANTGPGSQQFYLADSNGAGIGGLLFFIPDQSLNGFSLDNVALAKAPTPVPEPAVLPIVAASLLIGIFVRRRRG